MPVLDILLSYPFWVGASGAFLGGLYAGARLTVDGLR